MSDGAAHGIVKRRASTAWSISPSWISRDQLGDACLVAFVGRRRPRPLPATGHPHRRLVGSRDGEPARHLVEPIVGGFVLDGREGRRLRQVIERDDDGRQVEQRLGQADRVRLGYRQPFPAGGRLVGQVADAGGQREGERGGIHSTLRQQSPERLQRIVRLESLELLVVGVPDDRFGPVDDQRAAADPDERVAAISRAALDALEDEREAVAQAQRGRHRREGVGAPGDGDDAAAIAGKGWRGHEPATGPASSNSRSIASR